MRYQTKERYETMQRSGDLGLMISYPSWRLTFRDVRILTQEMPLLGAE